MSESQLYIPRNLDEPARFLIWTMDEAMALFLPIFVGVFFNHALLGLALGAASNIGIKKFKSYIGAHYKRWLYWYFPSELNLLKSTPSSTIREYVG
ncbi:MAG: type IV conjugative transfer system protein TraL [Legionellales bacterium]|nr:type IV conjugative transfer system protein TraL [Legionellales bacterium]